MESSTNPLQPSPSTLGVHLIGSIRLPGEADDPLTSPPSAEEIIKSVSKSLPNRLRRIPDGETGIRHYFVQWQTRVFGSSPWVFNDFERHARSIVVPENAASLEITLENTGYDEQAIASYASFEKLQDEGIIGPDARFQVCIPTPLNAVTPFVHPDYQERVEAKYETLLLEAVRNLQAHIPLSKLAIQLDCAVEFAALERAPGPGGVLVPWFKPSPQALVDRIKRLIAAVDSETELGLHLCYGDMNHQHFAQPKDTSKLVQMVNLIAGQVTHPLAFVHIPVPKDRTDDAYFAPLRELRLPKDVELYLGLVHARDVEGTKSRIDAARKVVQRFGIATECGLGRTPVQDISSIFEILKSFSNPV